MFKFTKSYILPISIVCSLVVAGAQQTIQASEKKTVYVSSSGNAADTGLSEETATTFATAYKNIADIDTIIVVDDMTYAEPPAHEGMLTIKGLSDDVDITLSNAVNLQGDLTVSNVNIIRSADNYHIYANGHSLVVADDVTSSQRLVAFGGTNGKSYTGDTDITLMGGSYDWVCGGSSNATLNGNTNIVFGGNANAGDTISSGCIVYGGGNNSNVTGETNVTLSGNAVCQYLFGGSRITNVQGVGSPQKLNIYIKGGKAMNIYGGALNYELSGCDVNVEMTGGVVEGIFGGSNGANLVGDVNIYLLGGNVTRRVYTGCYNDADFFLNYKTDYRVKGTTSLRIYPTMSVNNIASGNDSDKGVFAGSRYSSAFTDEINTVIFCDGCYDTHKNEVKHNYLGGYENYVVSATNGGDVQAVSETGKIYIESQPGKYAKVNGTGEYEKGEVTLANTGTTVNVVNFYDYNFKIHKLDVLAKTSGITAEVTYTANNNGTAKYSEPVMIAAVYDADGRLIASALNKNVEGAYEEYKFEIPCSPERGAEYTVKVMLWNIEDSNMALSNSITQTVKIGEKTALKQVMERLKGDYTAVINADMID